MSRAAVLTAGWDRRAPRNPAGPLGVQRGGSLNPGGDGVPFLPDELTGARLVVEAAFGADPAANPRTWAYTDITTDVLQDNGRTVSIRVGRQDWSSIAFPAGCTFALKNTTGKYTPYHPLAAHWPNMVPGVPIRVRIWYAGQYWDRFVGEAVGWTPAWDTTGNYAIVNVVAAGTLRRIAGSTGQTPPLHSALYRSIFSGNPVSYWPMEDGSTATQFTAAAGGNPMLFSGAFSPGSASGLPGSASLATPGVGAFAVGQVAAFPSTWVGSINGWAVPWVAKIPRQPAADTLLMEWYSADTAAQHWQVFVTAAGNVVTKLFNSAGVEQLGDPGFAFEWNSAGTNYGRWLLWSVYYMNVGGNAQVNIVTMDGANSTSFLNSLTLTGHFPGAPTSVSITGAAAAADSFSIGHVFVQPNTGFIDAWAAYGYPGEGAATRLARLCREEGVPFTRIGANSDKTMGAQGVDTLGNLLREGEATDAGFLYDGTAPGVTFQPLAARYNQAATLALDASAGDLQPPFAPVDDDFSRVNISSVTTKNGSTAVFQDSTGPLGTGKVPAVERSPAVTPNYTDSSLLYARASWEVHKGTVFGLRYPTEILNLRTIPAKAAQWLQVAPGSLITIVPPYSGQLPTDTLSQVVEGWQEDLARLRWTVAANCSVADAYLVGVVGSAVVATDGSTLAAPAAVGASSLSVQTNTGPIWTTTATFPADFPLYINVNGIQVKVTAIAGVSSPQTFTVDPATVTKQLNPGDPVALWKPGVIAL